MDIWTKRGKVIKHSNDTQGLVREINTNEKGKRR